MKPYVYIIQNKDRTHWYVGMRSANECPANADTGYWGSSKYLKALIKQTGKENWTKTIVAEFNTLQEASAHEVELLELMWDWPGRVNKARGGFVDHNDPQVRANHKAAMQKRSEDPEWIANNKAARESMYKDPVWQAKHRAAAAITGQKRSEDPEWIAKMKAINQKLAQDPVWQANNRAGGRKRAKPFIAASIATGEEFYCESTICEQARALKLNSGNVSSCLNGKQKQHKGYTFRYA